MPAFRARYLEWWPQAEPLIREHEYQHAFKTYPFPKFDSAPWTMPRVPLAEAKVALVTTAAMYRKGPTCRSMAAIPKGISASV